METDAQHMTLVDHHKLRRFVAAAFGKLGVAPADAAIAANVLVMADLRGVDTHGVIRFNPGSWYVKWLRDGEMTPEPKIRVVSDAVSSALLDGDRGIGMVIGHRAMELAIEKAKASGVGMVGVCNSRHFGMSAYYAMQALPHDMIGTR
jgi:L-2-hydroxycarboxylate dehydrogenase (NAD+)